MLHLNAKAEFISARNPADRPVLRLTAGEVSQSDSREAFLVTDASLCPGYGVYLFPSYKRERVTELPAGSEGVVLPPDLDHLSAGDVIRLAPDKGRVSVLYRKESPHNSFLITERCDHYCLMCSQPPRDIDDGWIIDEILETIPLIDRTTRELGFTGGEPTMLGSRFLEVLRSSKEHLPDTALHVLSNGRRFSKPAFAKAWAGLEHPDLMVGIPVYSDVSSTHNYVVQAEGAFDETIRGILNLKQLRQKVEIRVVLHKQTYARLPQLARFISRNLVFVDHVALMGLEIMGFTRANLEELWIDPIEYQSQLCEAVSILSNSGMQVSIYNLQLCLLDRSLWPFAAKSISDWKREYLPQCERCSVKADCGGLFFSAKYKCSENIRPILGVVEGAL